MSFLINSYMFATLSGAAVALDLYELPGFGYTGPLIRVRRSSDNTEADFYQGFTAGELNTTRGGGGTSLASWVGANNGFIRTWYDQSVNARDYIQTTAGQQPRIVTNGSTETVNGKPAIYFTGGLCRLEGPDISFTESTTMSVFRLDNYAAAFDIGAIFGRHASSNFKWMAFLFATTNNNRVHYNEVPDGATFRESYAAVNAKSNQVLAFGWRDSSNLHVYADNTAPTVENAVPSSGTGWNGTSIGNLYAGGSWDYYGLQGHIQSIIHYTSDRSSDRTALQTIVNSYYGAF